MFNEFLDETTPVPTMINVDDVKTVDLAGFDKEEDDFPIYDTEIVVKLIFLPSSFLSYIHNYMISYLITHSPSSPFQPPHLSPS